MDDANINYNYNQDSNKIGFQSGVNSNQSLPKLNVDHSMNIPMNFSFKKKGKSPNAQNNRDDGLVINRNQDERFYGSGGKSKANDIHSNKKFSKHVGESH